MVHFLEMIIFSHNAHFNNGEKIASFHGIQKSEIFQTLPGIQEAHYIRHELCNDP